MDSLSQASLISDTLILVRREPARMLFQRGCAVWGLSPVFINDTLWIALSLAGCAVLAARQRPWLHPTTPDLTALGNGLRPHLLHVVSKSTRSFLFALPSSPFGLWGKQVLLCQVTNTNFPWLETTTSVPATESQIDLPESLWQQFATVTAQDILHLQAGGVLPPDDAGQDFFRRHLHYAGPADLSSEADRIRLRSTLLEAVDRERARILLINALIGPTEDLGVPEWISHPLESIDQFISMGLPLQDEDPSLEMPDLGRVEPESTRADIPEPRRARRPTHHPNLIPSRMPPPPQPTSDESSGPSEI